MSVGRVKKRWLSLIVVVLVVVGAMFFMDDGGGDRSTLSDFEDEVGLGNVESVIVDEWGLKIMYEVEGEWDEVGVPSRYYEVNNDLFKELKDQGVGVEYSPSMDSRHWASFLSLGFMFMFLLLVGYFIYRAVKKSGDSGKVSKVDVGEGEKTTFRDVAGMHNVKEEMKEIVGYLKDPEKFKNYTEVFPKGILLEGSPGNGKTLLARALAGESSTPFYQISASDIEGMFVGLGANRISNVFKEAKKGADEFGKSILFIDEIDTIGIDRSKRTVAETSQTLNKLLTEMDGFEKSSNVLVLAATNLVESLDAALTRSGRFDRIIKIPDPGYEDRLEIIRLYLGKKEEIVASSVRESGYDEVLASQTEGFCSADLFRLVNDASLLAFKQGKKIDARVLREGFTRCVLGLPLNSRIDEDEMEIVSYHEAGHAVVEMAQDDRGVYAIAHAVLKPYSNSLGHVAYVGDNKSLHLKSGLEKKVRSLMAGRAVEDRKLHGDFSVGAGNDLMKVNSILYSMVAEYGMGESTKHIHVRRQESKGMGEEWIKEEVDRLRNRLYGETQELVDRYWDEITGFAELLKERGDLDQEDIVKEFGEVFTWKV